MTSFDDFAARLRELGRALERALAPFVAAVEAVTGSLRLLVLLLHDLIGSVAALAIVPPAVVTPDLGAAPRGVGDPRPLLLQWAILRGLSGVAP